MYCDLYWTHINVCERRTAQMMTRPAPASFAQFAKVCYSLLQFAGWHLDRYYCAESLYKQAVKFNWTTW